MEVFTVTSFVLVTNCYKIFFEHFNPIDFLFNRSKLFEFLMV